eukprot:12271931-Alexandrium_andersonii.AAC.1
MLGVSAVRRAIRPGTDRLTIAHDQNLGFTGWKEALWVRREALWDWRETSVDNAGCLGSARGAIE